MSGSLTSRPPINRKPQDDVGLTRRTSNYKCSDELISTTSLSKSVIMTSPDIYVIRFPVPEFSSIGQWSSRSK